MSELSLKKRQFHQQLVSSGKPPDIPEAANWMKRFRRIAPPELAENPRLVNRFKIGADPEFIFELAPEGGKPMRVDAAGLGLKPGLFVGADQNGRLAELRPMSSRSALDVTASLLESLRLMAHLYPQAMEYEWKAGAFLHGDGLGGHIHFGRKQPNRGVEITGLDAVTTMLERLKVFPTKEIEKRRLGDDRRQAYGLLGDYRLQAHGYEYRTLPSWLDSPWLAFMSLTLGKLAVHDPSVVLNWQNLELKPHSEFIYNLLAYYKGRDDDAALAYAGLSTRKGLPRHEGGDFRSRWGLDYTALHRLDATFMPSEVAPSKEAREDLFRYFLSGETLPKREPKISWKPAHVPKGFVPLIDTVQPRQIGMGELLWNMVTTAENGVVVSPGDYAKDVAVVLSRKLARSLPADWRRQLRAMPQHGKFVVAPEGKSNLSSYMIINREWRKNAKNLKTLRQILLSGLFPLWKIEDATSDVLAARAAKPISEKKQYGRVLHDFQEGVR